MSLLTLAAAALLSLTDPTGDAAGDGTLEPPTSPVYANAALFDLQEVSVVSATEQGGSDTLRVAMGAVEVDESQPGGFNRAVVDVYLDFADGGAPATLEGPGMLMPPGTGWEYAVRVSPRGAFGAPAPLEADQPVEWAPLDLAIEGDVLVVGLPAGIGSEVDAFAVTGVYDAFSPQSWRPLASSPSPWSYSGTEQVVPVIDLIAADHATQMRALREGVLPAPARRMADGLTWLLLSMAGVLISATGLWMRRMVGAGGQQSAEAGLAVAGVEVEAETVPDGETQEGTTEVVPVGAGEDGQPTDVVVAEADAEPAEEEAPAVPETVDEATAGPEAEEEAPAVPETEHEATRGPEAVDEATAAHDAAIEALTEPEPNGLVSAEAAPDTAAAVDVDPAAEERAPDGAAGDKDEEDVFDRLGSELDDSDEPEDDLIGFSDAGDRRARHLRVEHSDEDGDQAGS